MSTLEILNEALINYTAVIRDSVNGKADTLDILQIISNTSNELKDLISTKADIELLSSVLAGNSNEFSGLFTNMQNDVNKRVLISDYNADNIQSNIRFNTKADIFNSTLTGLTSAQTIHSIGDIRTGGTLYASNLHVLGQTSIVNTVTTVTDQLTITNYGTDVAFIVNQNGTTNMAEFYNSSELVTVIDKYGRIGINRSPRYEIDVSGTICGSIIYGDTSKTTVNNVFIEDIFSSNLTLVDDLRLYVNDTIYLIHSNIDIITNTINYGKEQFLNAVGLSSQYETIADRLNSLEARISQLEQRL